MEIVKKPDPTTQYAKTPAYCVRLLKTDTGETVEHRRTLQFEDKIIMWKDISDIIEGIVSRGTFEDLKKIYEAVTGRKYSGYYRKKDVLKKLLKFYFKYEEPKPKKVLEYVVYGIKKLRSIVESEEKRLSKIFRKYAILSGRWGLGCPYNCGRHWIFKPSDDLSGFVPEDPYAMSGPQPTVLDSWVYVAPDTIWIEDDSGNLVEVPNPDAGKKTTYYKIRMPDGTEQVVTEIPVNRGYLEWTVLDDGSVRFVCDRCGGTIVLQ